MGAAKKVIGIIFLILVIIGAVVVWSYLKPAIPAELREATGTVEVNTGGDWRAASIGQKLNQGDAVRTTDGEATIIFFGGTILRLDRETEITISKMNKGTATVSIQQDKGRTWNRVVRKSDNTMAESLAKVKGSGGYDVQLPNAVATVRGTSFSVQVDPATVSVVIGTVNFGTEGDAADVSSQTATVENGAITVTVLEMDDWISGNMEKDDKFDQALLAAIKQKYGFVIKKVKTKYDLTDDDIDNAILGYLKSGGGEIPELTEEQKQALEDDELTDEEIDEILEGESPTS